jgi:4-amino-4-deoxy-L-arabinose transferase-like glycosyltransferase
VTRPTPTRRLSYTLILTSWLILQLGGLFTPGLLDDVDSVYIQIAREMLQRHDLITPTIDGIRFFDKPPLMYWLAAGSMRVFGIHDWAARLPLALGVLALLFAVYALANRFFRAVSPAHAPDRAGLYAALATSTCIGIYLYTRFFIPDILVTLFMVLSVHTFLIAVERANTQQSSLPTHLETLNSPQQPGAPRLDSETWVSKMPDRAPSPLLPMLAFAATLALSLLTKGLIGILFPLLFAILYLAITRQLRLLTKLHLAASTAVFALIAAPWHILAALRNPAIPMPPGVGLPAKAGWAWFYLYNEHIARFLGRRIPHDYGQTPIPLFWLLLVLWLLPWAAFLPAALKEAILALRTHRRERTLRFDSDPDFAYDALATTTPDRSHEAALTLILWPAIVLLFFTLSSRQEYYHLPALPALAILLAGLLAAADRPLTLAQSDPAPHRLPLLFGLPSTTRKQTLRAALWFLVPFGTLLFLLCGYFALTAPTPPPGSDLYTLLNSNPANYNLSLGHLYDLTGRAMGFFRGPLLTVALGMITLGPIAYILRRRSHTFAANLTFAAGMIAVLLAAHTGLTRFNPILGSKDLALAINAQKHPGDILALDGELTSGSTLLFYSTQPNEHVLLINGRINGPWFGSFFPDAPQIFLTDPDLHHLWSGPHRIFLLTYHPDQRIPDLNHFAPTHTFAESGGKTILTNR